MTRFYAACRLALAVFAVALAGLSGTAQAQQSGNRFQGLLSVVWGDPHPSIQGGTTRFTIVYPGGQRVPLDVPSDLRNELIKYSGKRVTVRGNASAESGSPRIRVESIEAPEAGPQTEAVIGTRSVLFILLRFQNETQEPHTPAFFINMTKPLKPSAGIPGTINGFFNRVSYGQFLWAPAVAGNKWYTLPRTRAQYCGGNCGPSGDDINLDLLGDDALALVAGDVNVNKFNNINFVFNNDLDCCAWGGTYVNNAGTRSWGATWEPPWGQETSTYVHEMGHSLGLPHSGWRYYAYDSHHDEMSRGHPASSVNCGSYNSVNFGGPGTAINCTKPGAGYIAAHQDFLGWIPAANQKTVAAIGTKPFIIEANSAPLGTRVKLVKVCLKNFPCTGGNGSTARFITIEVKLKGADFDNGVPSEGVVIHDVMMNRRNTISGPCYFNNQNGWALPFDANPGDFNSTTCQPQDVVGTGLLDMAYATGQTFSAYGVQVAVGAKSGNTYTVTVTKTK